MWPFVAVMLARQWRNYLRRYFVYDLAAAAACLSTGTVAFAVVPYAALAYRKLK